jgi:hypothetical protein
VGYPDKNESLWSRLEKVIARNAFDAALGQELHEVIRKAKKMDSQIQQVSDLWDLEHYLTHRRRRSGRKHDYRSLQLMRVFGRLCTRGDSVRKSCAATGNQRLK